jgi:hypothetical protein
VVVLEGWVVVLGGRVVVEVPGLVVVVLPGAVVLVVDVDVVVDVVSVFEPTTVIDADAAPV